MRLIARTVIDLIATSAAFATAAVAFDSHFAGVASANAVVLYGIWCFWDGITPRKGER